jgi:hypothetical protein
LLHDFINQAEIVIHLRGAKKYGWHSITLYRISTLDLAKGARAFTQMHHRRTRNPGTRRYPTLATLYRAGMTNVVLHCLFMQQNQRV